MVRSEQFLRVLKPTGSFVLNIKEKAENGERHVYVLELILALRKQGWLWTEEYIWHKRNCHPGKWPNRFRDFGRAFSSNMRRHLKCMFRRSPEEMEIMNFVREASMSYESKMLSKLAMPKRERVEHVLLRTLLKHGGVIKEFSSGEETVTEMADELALSKPQRYPCN